MQGCTARGITIIRGNITKNHVHLLVSCPPTLAPAKIVQYLKGRSSKILQEEFNVLKKRYWGQHLWSPGYFCRSVGTVTQEIIKAYIEDQTDDIEKTFKITKWLLVAISAFSGESSPALWVQGGWQKVIFLREL